MVRRVRVLVVDDSAFARKVIREVLTADPRIEVIAIARDGVDALEKITELTPDVVTLDLVMPQLDGIAVLEAIRCLAQPPRVVVVTMSDADSVLGVAALQAGAFDVVHKPTAHATDRLYDLGKELLETVLRAAEAKGAAPRTSPVPEVGGVVAALAATRTAMLLIGASTGGPRAITQLLRALPADFPVPIAIVVHMPPGYTEAFASRLDRECALHVVQGEEGLLLRPGLVVIAHAGLHLKLKAAPKGWSATLDSEPTGLHRPSVDALFTSAAEQVGRKALGVVLTGMGSDGLEGARAIRAAGGQVVVEHESTCVVYGMPRSIAEQGLADAQVPLPEIATAIIERL